MEQTKSLELFLSFSAFLDSGVFSSAHVMRHNKRHPYFSPKPNPSTWHKHLQINQQLNFDQIKFYILNSRITI